MKSDRSEPLQHREERHQSLTEWQQRRKERQCVLSLALTAGRREDDRTDLLRPPAESAAAAAAAAAADSLSHELGRGPVGTAGATGGQLDCPL